jgi:hypothetical protein
MQMTLPTPIQLQHNEDTLCVHQSVYLPHQDILMCMKRMLVKDNTQGSRTFSANARSASSVLSPIRVVTLPPAPYVSVASLHNALRGCACMRSSAPGWEVHVHV